MAENAKIAALRANSQTSPSSASGPQALAYPWMTAAGRELVIPERAPIDQQAWRNARDAQSKRPPPPTSPAGGPKLPPGFRGKSVIPVNPASTGRDIRPQVGGEPEFYADMYVPQNPVYTPDEAQSEVPTEPTYFDPGQYSYVPEVFAPSAPSAAQEQTVSLPQLKANEMQSEPEYFDFGEYSYVPESTASTPAASPEPAPMPAQTQSTASMQLQPYFSMENFSAPASEPTPVPAPQPPPVVSEMSPEPVYFDPGQYSYIPAPLSMPAQTFEYESPSAPAVAQTQVPDQTPELMMYDPALLEMLQQQEDPLMQMKMAYGDQFGRFFEQ